ncbi:hypothetical protein ABZS66_23350 [Dactylosporangium sp. NPDC005572]|uniref:hypothetical protein n=1 Tax=Dactylosporangium sp. NPDC005572 TaxID=3156889 RepID=UPI0033BEC888
MAGSEWIEWRRSFPSRSLSTLAWYAVCATLAVLLVRALFAGEPAVLDSGAHNPLADAPIWMLAVACVGVVPAVLSVARRPRVGANHFALTVRPGWIRTLVLPWSRVAEVSMVEIEGERYLVIGLRASLDRTGTNPAWPDRSVLRELAKSDARRAGHYDVAVRLRDFAGGPESQMSSLAAFAPDEVHMKNHLPSS